MPKDLKIDNDGNLVWENGRLVWVTGSDYTRQKLQVRLGMWYGEWFLNNEIGVKTKEKILIKQYSLPDIELHLRETIINTPTVVELLTYSQSIEIVGNKKTLKVEFSVLDETQQQINIERGFGV